MCSTGNPKGALITHRNIVSDCSAFVKATEVTFWDVVIFPHWLTLVLENESAEGDTTVLGPCGI